MNTTAMLCTRAIAEMNRLARALGSSEATLAGLAGIGCVRVGKGRCSRMREGTAAHVPTPRAEI